MITTVPFLSAKIPDDRYFFKLKEISYSDDGWVLDYIKNEIKIWSKSAEDSTIKTVKVRTFFSGVNSRDVYYTLLDPVYRKTWDAHMVIGYEIGFLNHNNIVTYYGASCPPLKKRDFVLQNSWLDTGLEHYVINHSVCHKDHPPRPGFVRAISYLTGYFIKSIPNEGCEVYFVSRTDPQGIIPAWVVNKCTQIFAPRVVRTVEHAALNYNSWKSSNNSNYFPWLHPEQMKYPKITVADCVPSEEERKSAFYHYLEQKYIKLNPTVQFAGNPVLTHSELPPVQKTSNTSQPMKDGGKKRERKKSTLKINLGKKPEDKV